MHTKEEIQAFLEEYKNSTISCKELYNKHNITQKAALLLVDKFNLPRRPKGCNMMLEKLADEMLGIPYTGSKNKKEINVVDVESEEDRNKRIETLAQKKFEEEEHKVNIDAKVKKNKK